MKKLIIFSIICTLFVFLIGNGICTVRNTVMSVVYDTVLETIDSLDVNEEHIYISSSADPGGDGSISTPYDAFSDINWTTNGDNSIFDWIVDGSKVYITLVGDLDEQFTFGTDGTASARITLRLNGYSINATGDNFGVYTNTQHYCSVVGSGTIKNANRYGIYTIASTNFIAKNLTVTAIGTAGTSNEGIRIINGCTDFLVDNVDVHTISTGLINTGIDIGATGAAHTTGVIKYCNVYAISGATYGQGIKFVADDKTLDVLTVKWNLIYNTDRYGIVTGGDGGTLYAYHNTLWDAETVNGRNFLSSNSGTLNGRVSILKNNVFDGSPKTHVDIDPRYDDFTHDYNVYSTIAGTNTFRNGETAAYYNLAGWIVAQTQEANSIEENPDLTSIGQLETGSPALETGVAISGINDVGTLDTWGNAAGTLKNIGAYQGTGYVCSIPSGYEQLLDGNGDNIYDNLGECIVVPSGATTYWNSPRTSYWTDARTSLWNTTRDSTP